MTNSVDRRRVRRNVVSLLALTAAVVQPWAGRALDAAPRGVVVGVLITALGLSAAALPGLGGILIAATAIGAGTGTITPLAFTGLARCTPAQHLGQTMGAAEVGRECGDMAGPLLVAAIATATTLALGYLGLAALVVVVLAVTAVTVHTTAPAISTPPGR